MLLKKILIFVLLWIILLSITTIVHYPTTELYYNALDKFKEISAEINETQYMHNSFMYGFLVGYLISHGQDLIIIYLIISALCAALLIYMFSIFNRNKENLLFLPDPLDSLKNVLATIILFTFGIFLRRASEQLRLYFALPPVSRLIGTLAYGLVFFAIALNYDYPDHAFYEQLASLTYLQSFIPVALIALTMFYPAFRKNLSRRLFWLSLSGLMIIWIMSITIGMEMAQQGFDDPELMTTDLSFLDSGKIMINFLIVLAFSFYLEVMKLVFTQKTRVETEMSVAQNIQAELLPELIEKTESYEIQGITIPANEVGGDYCDVIHLQDGRMAIAVGDVSGHNVAAGVMMAMLKVSFRTELNYLQDPADLARSLNKTIYENKNKNMFASLLFCLLDAGTKELTYVNCGHPALLHFSAADKSCSEYRTGDPALGLQKDVHFVHKSILLNKQDIIVLFSDGLPETINTSGHEFGLHKVKEIVQQHALESAQIIQQKLVTEMNTFRQKSDQRDDITIIVFKML
jgi:serine phosphatase RsbU (regulator of sigma subunit)